MSETLLANQTLPIALEQEAADSRFFNTEAPILSIDIEEFIRNFESQKKIMDFHKISENFLYYNSSYMANDAIYAWQVGISRRGLCDPTDEDVGDRVSVIFDARHKQDNKYSWQIIEADQEGRTAHKITIGDGSVEAYRSQWDPAGRLVSENRLDSDETDEVMALVVDINHDSAFKQHILDRREVSKKARKGVEDFKKEKENYGKLLFEDKLKKLEKQARKLGLVAYLAP